MRRIRWRICCRTRGTVPMDGSARRSPRRRRGSTRSGPPSVAWTAPTATATWCACVPRSRIMWNLLVEPEGRGGAENMAIDEALLEDADRRGEAFLRLYRWDPPCLSLGRNDPAPVRPGTATV